MTVEPAQLLLIRPKAQSLAFLDECEARLGRRIEAVVSPIFQIEPIGELPDLRDFGTTVVTSSNAVRRLTDNLAGRDVATVGQATADLARSYGAQIVNSAETAQALLDQVEGLTSPVLICRGVHARIDLVTALQQRGIVAKDAIIYDQIARPLSTEAIAMLSDVRHVVVPLFSPRSAVLFSEQSYSAPLKLIAISDAVRLAWAGQGDVQVARSPTSGAMCDLVTEAL
ncbi:uroporphyrinogen-III synthase [Rhodobacteraceae bacterium]|nr:uroporphyrinogen-III synthase [Paracoccaceae bacterium]